MRNRILAYLTTLATIIGVSVFAFASPASAYSTGQSCVSYNGITQCAGVTWINNAQGILLTGTNGSTPTGCGKMESDYQTNKYIVRHFSPTGYTWGNWGPYTGDCNPGIGLYNVAPATSFVDISWWQRRNNAADVLVYWRYKIFAGGGSVLIDKGYDFGPCC